MTSLTTSIIAGAGGGGGSVDVGSLVAHIVADVSKLSMGTQQAVKKVQTMTTRIKGYLKENLENWKRSMNQLVAGGTAALAGIALLTREFIKFDKAMRIATAVSTVSATQFEQMSSMATAVSKQWGIAASNAAQAFYFLGSAGLDATEQMEAFDSVALLATATTLQMGEASDMVVNTMKGFHVEFSKTNEVVDTLVAGVISANHTMYQLGEAFSYVAGIAHQAHNTIGQTAAALGFMADMGIKGSLAGTVLRRALINLMAPTSEIRKELERWGIVVYNADGRMRPFVDLIGQLNDALKAATEEEKNHAYRIIFGARAISGMVGVLNRGAKELHAYSVELENAGDTAQNVAEKQMLALGKEVDRLKQDMAELAREISTTIVPWLRNLIRVVKETVSTITDWVKSHSAITQTIVKFTATIGALALALGLGGRGLIFVIQSSIMVIGTFHRAIGGAMLGLVKLKIVGAAAAGVIGGVFTAALIAAGLLLAALDERIANIEARVAKLKAQAAKLRTTAEGIVEGKKELEEAIQIDASHSDLDLHIEQLQDIIDKSDTLLKHTKDYVVYLNTKWRAAHAENDQLEMNRLQRRMFKYEAEIALLEDHQERDKKIMEELQEMERMRNKAAASARQNSEEAAKALEKQQEAQLKHLRRTQEMTRMERITTLKDLRSRISEESDLWDDVDDEILATQLERTNAMKVYMAEMREDMQDTAIYGAEKFAEVFQSIEGSMSSALSSMIMGTANFKEAMTRMANDILKSFADMISQMISRWISFQLLSGLFPAFGVPNISAPSSIPRLAEGGIVTKPTLAHLGEGGKPEAVIPLDKLENQGGVIINIINPWDGASVMKAVEDRSIQAVLKNYGHNGPIRTIIRQGAKGR